MTAELSLWRLLLVGQAVEWQTPLSCVEVATQLQEGIGSANPAAQFLLAGVPGKAILRRVDDEGFRIDFGWGRVFFRLYGTCAQRADTRTVRIDIRAPVLSLPLDLVWIGLVVLAVVHTRANVGVVAFLLTACFVSELQTWKAFAGLRLFVSQLSEVLGADSSAGGPSGKGRALGLSD